MSLKPERNSLLADKKALWQERSVDASRLTAITKQDQEKQDAPKPGGAPSLRDILGPRRTLRPAARDAVSVVAERLRGKSHVGSALSPVELYLQQQLPALERSLFAPPVLIVARSIASALFRPAIFAALCVGILVLPDRASLAVFPVRDGSTSAVELASAFVADHHSSKDIRKAAYRTAAGWASENDQVRLPILREFAEGERPVLKTTAALVSMPFSLKAKTPVLDYKRPVSNDRRSLVKFISGLIAAFRPQLADSAQIARHIVELSGSEHVDPLYVAAVIAIESRFSSTARSGVGATGLMQIMPMTGRELAEKHNIRHRRGGLNDPRTNIQLGIRYLKEMEQRYKGNRFLALAAYNWGPANVDQTRGREGNIPGSVRKYSKTILDRASNWRRHFARANESAELLAEVPVPRARS